MKYMTAAKRFGAKVVTAVALAAPAFAFAAGSGNAVLDAVDFSTVATWVGATGVIIVGIAMAFKGIALGKRAVSKV